MDDDTPTGTDTFFDAALLAVQAALDTFWSWIVGMFFLPGDYVLAFLLARAPGLAGRIGIGEDSFGGPFAGVFSAVFWIVTLVLVLAALRAIRFWLRALAGFVLNFLIAVRHRQRMFNRKLGAPVRKIRQTLRPARSTLEEFEIDALQMAIMHEQTKLAPGHVMTALDVSHQFRVRPGRAQQALDQLKRLHLVEVSFGTTDGYPGYLLTKPGQVFLASWNRNRNTAAARSRGRVGAR